MSFLAIYLWGCFIFALILFVFLFGSLPEFQQSPIGKLRRVLLWPVRSARKFDDHFLRGQISRTAVSWYKTHSGELAYGIPVGYALLLIVFMYLFMRDCLPKLENQQFIVSLTCVLPFISLIICVLSDPGRIDSPERLSWALENFTADRIIFYERRTCSTCRFEKPARSKHCSVCNSCIMTCDHHCIWINNCVGYRNYRWFLIFIVVNLNMLYRGSLYTYGILQNQRLTNTSKNGFIGSWIEAIYTSNATRTAGMIMLLCSILIFVVAGFLVIHLRYIYEGCTTNESAKWQEIADVIEEGSLYKYEYPTSAEREKAREQKRTEIVLQKTGPDTFHRPLSKQESKLIKDNSMILQQVTSFEDIRNIYDDGFLNNLMFFLFPRI